MLAKAGVTLAQTQKLMRHSTPVLTARTYLKLRIEGGHEAAAKIDAPGQAAQGADEASSAGATTRSRRPARRA